MLNIYCDESCHLENDNHAAMVIGSIKIPRAQVREVSEDIKRIKVLHGLSKHAEIKWTKVSPSKLPFYMDLLDYFFENSSLGFRAIIIQDKHKLSHDVFDQTHDEWYYKMYFLMLRNIVNVNDTHVYLDIKDTNSNAKVVKLQRYICNSLRDFNRKKVTKMQHIRSEESQILQLVDLLIGAISYENRGLDTSATKVALVSHIQQKTGLTLRDNTAYGRTKFNLLTFQPK